MLNLLIRNGTIVDGQGCLRGSLGIADGRIVARFAEGAELPHAKQTIDAASLMVLPELVDPHVHFYGEGIGEFSRLAAIGGVTTFIGMIRGAPEEALADVVARHRAEGLTDAVADFSFHVVLYDREDTIGQIPRLAADGFRSFKIFLAYKRRGMMARESFLFAAMDEIRRQGEVVLVHAEDGELIDRLEQEAQSKGRIQKEHYASTRPPEAEAAAIDVVGLAAGATGCTAYIVHVSSALGLAAVARARERGVPIWAETCPQYLLLDDEAVRQYGPAAVIAPPLRSAADRKALGAALASGAINSIGTDHASYSRAAKAKGADNIFASPFGMPGAPMLWPAMYGWALDHEVALPILVRALAETPARLFGLAPRKGTLLPGADADVILIDPHKQQQILDAGRIWPNVCPSPMAELSLPCLPVMTLSRGEIIAQSGEITGKPGRAQHLIQKPS